MNESRFGLTDAVDSTYGLQFVAGIKNGLEKEDMCGFSQVETVCTRLDWQKQHANGRIVFESIKILLHLSAKERTMHQSVLVQSAAQNHQHFGPLKKTKLSIKQLK